MWLAEENRSHKHDLVLARPLVNASGTLGFTPDRHTTSALPHLGAFITNPISRKPRQPAGNRACLPFAGGFLLHTGHPNPGITQVLRRYQRRWASAELPVIINLLAEAPPSLAEMVRKLEGLENILAIELGLPPGCDADRLQSLMGAGLGELPLIPCLSPEQIPLLMDTLMDLQPAAVHLTEPRGALPGPEGLIVTGRLYGPAIFPLMLAAAQTLNQAGLRVLVNGGVIVRWQVDALLDAGVTAVGLGSFLWGVDQGDVFIAP